MDKIIHIIHISFRQKSAFVSKDKRRLEGMLPAFVVRVCIVHVCRAGHALGFLCGGFLLGLGFGLCLLGGGFFRGLCLLSRLFLGKGVKENLSILSP